MARDPNPMAQSFSEMVTEWERNFDAFANQVMGTDAYSQAMNEMQKTQLHYQKGMSEMMAQHLCNLNMPTREDVLQLAEAVRQLDRRLERIEDKLFFNDEPPVAKKKPARTRTPPKATAVQVEEKTGKAGKTTATSQDEAKNVRARGRATKAGGVETSASVAGKENNNG